MFRPEIKIPPPLYDRLANHFVRPYRYISYEELHRLTGAGRKVIADNLSDVRGTANKDIEGILHMGGWCLVPENAGNQFDLINFRNPPSEIAELPDVQWNMFQKIWQLAPTVDRIEYQWKDQTIHVLKPVMPERVHEMLCVLIKLAKKNNGLKWYDLYPEHIGITRGVNDLKAVAGAMNDFCKAQSLPFHMTSLYGTTEYRLFSK